MLLIPASAAIYVVATMECFIGICFLIGSGALMRLAIWVLAAQFVGILSPLIIEPGQLFAGPHGAPTLEGQYVLKDIILVAAGMVIAAGTFRGGKLVREEPQVDPSGGLGHSAHHIVSVSGSRSADFSASCPGSGLSMSRKASITLARASSRVPPWLMAQGTSGVEAMTQPSSPCSYTIVS